MRAAPPTICVLLLQIAGAMAQPTRPSSCEACHSAAAAAHRGSAHQLAGLSCVDCHGGNPDDMDETAMSPSAGFRGKPSRAEQPTFCASCHSQSAMMRPYGLPTNQLEEYMQSRHGRALAAGETRVAVCADCHTAHNVRPPGDPRSSVAPENVPSTCAKCHENERLMRARGVPTGQVAAYRDSVHGKALLVGKNQAAPTCTTCHGSHGAAPPALRSVHHVCARCHPNDAKQFGEGPHGEATEAGRMTPCVSCHTAHSVQHPTDDDLLTWCDRCHQGKAEIAQVARSIHDEIQRARTMFEEAEREIQDAPHGDLPREQLDTQVANARTALLQTAVAQHSLRLRDVERQTAVVLSLHEDLRAAAERRVEKLRVRKALLFYVWGYLAATIAALWIKRQRVEAERLAALGGHP